MSIEKAVRITDAAGSQLLKGRVRNVKQVWPGKVLFDVGKFTCKAFGSTADGIKKVEGQIVEMFGEWERLRKYPDREEFICKGRYGTAFQASASTPVPSFTSNSQSGPVAAQTTSEPAPSKSPALPLKVAPAPKKESIEASLSLATRSLIRTMRGITTVEELEDIIANPIKYGIFKNEAAKILLEELNSRIEVAI